uniref:Uncharacterized protein n=1 Tax=Anguilla anguilla TaxID=7936 RepID=A0A0E9Q4U8_ANGAN
MASLNSTEKCFNKIIDLVFISSILVFQGGIEAL